MTIPTLPLRPAAVSILAAALLAGCVKPAELKAPEPKPAAQPEAFATAPAAPTQAPSVAGIPSAAIAAAERVKMKVEVASTATVDNGALYKQAQALFAESKHAEALALLDTIQQELLTQPQEKAVAELRAKIKAAAGK
jgi:hypothetical protein